MVDEVAVVGEGPPGTYRRLTRQVLGRGPKGRPDESDSGPTTESE